jgi:hypothetical protein
LPRLPDAIFAIDFLSLAAATLSAFIVARRHASQVYFRHIVLSERSPPVRRRVLLTPLPAADDASSLAFSRH